MKKELCDLLLCLFKLTSLVLFHLSDLNRLVGQQESEKCDRYLHFFNLRFITHILLTYYYFTAKTFKKTPLLILQQVCETYKLYFEPITLDIKAKHHWYYLKFLLLKRMYTFIYTLRILYVYFLNIIQYWKLWVKLSRGQEEFQNHETSDKMNISTFYFFSRFWSLKNGISSFPVQATTKAFHCFIVLLVFLELNRLLRSHSPPHCCCKEICSSNTRWNEYLLHP